MVYCVAALVALSLGAVTAGAQSSARGASGAPPAPEPQSSIRVTDSPQIFATLCALYAAGDLAVPSNASPQLKEMVLQLETMHGPSVTALTTFYRNHRLPSNSATVARYVSFAMVVGPPPSFSYVFPLNQLPPDVHALDGFRELLGDFYVQQHIGSLWSQVEPSYHGQTVRLRGRVSEVVRVATAYARRMKEFAPDRTFTVYVDPLVGSETNFRIYSESYKIAVNPASGGTIPDIRLAFLHYLLDPMVFNDPAVVRSRKFLFNFAVHAPRLPHEYKQDFVAFTDECLVRAVALRLGSLSKAAREAALTRNDRDGYILVRPLYENLKNYENSFSTLAQYFPHLISSIDVKSEAARDQKIVFSPATAPPPAPVDTKASRVRAWLALGDRQIAAQQTQDAVETFERILQLDPGNAKAEYGLAVASAMGGQGKRARRLFQQAASSPSADPSTRSWAHVFLGRINDLAGRRQEALVQYRDALAVAGIPATARAAAEQGIQQAFTAGKPGAGASERR